MKSFLFDTKVCLFGQSHIKSKTLSPSNPKSER